jgi:hypothetical protein
VAPRGGGALAVFLALATTLALVAKASAITIFSASGNDASDIQGTVDTFRAALGNPDNGNGPPSATGHREINWNGGGSTGHLARGTPFRRRRPAAAAAASPPSSGTPPTGRSSTPSAHRGCSCRRAAT